MKVVFLLTKLRLRCSAKLINRENTNDARIAGTTINHLSWRPSWYVFM